MKHLHWFIKNSEIFKMASSISIFEIEIRKTFFTHWYRLKNTSRNTTYWVYPNFMISFRDLISFDDAPIILWYIEILGMPLFSIQQLAKQ